MERKGFTLVELLVVIAIIALLMGILMPALAKVRQLAYRLHCGTQLSGIGKAMLVYSNDYNDELPRAGGPSSTLGPTDDWRAATQRAAFGLNADGSGGQASIAACFYLLVKYVDVTPKSFLCKGDSGVTQFKPSDYGAGGIDLIDLWDFGPKPQKHCSYSYHIPYGHSSSRGGGGGASYALTASSEPGMAVVADRNPWQDSPGASARPGSDWSAFNPDGPRESIRKGNALTHQEDGQNVLFTDGHVKFEKSPSCGINGDNIYTTWTNAEPASAERKKGLQFQFGRSPMHRLDSLLVTDGN